MKTSELQIIIDKPITKVRRWVRDALPTDPLAKERSGYVREFSDEEGFLVYLFGWMIEYRKFNKDDARAVIDAITPWVIEKFSPIKEKGSNIGSWELYIGKTVQDSLHVEAMKRIKTETFVDQVKTSTVGHRKFDFEMSGKVERVLGDGAPQCLTRAGSWILIIPITSLAYGFCENVGLKNT